LLLSYWKFCHNNSNSFFFLLAFCSRVSRCDNPIEC